MGWKKVKLSKILKLYRIEHLVQNDKDYHQITISKNNGISLRGKKSGKNIGRKRQFIIDLDKFPNTILFTRQGVRDGAIGIAPREVNSCIVTENMPMMSVDINKIEMNYLKKLLISEYLFEKIRKLLVVGSAQKSIHERDLLNIKIFLPTIQDQKYICRKFETLDIEHTELKTELTQQQTLLKKLRQQILQEAIEGKLTEQWRIDNGKLKIEAASELLKRIQAEKEQLIKDKKIKKQKPLLPISEEEKPFDLPDGWVWCRLGEASYGFQYGTSSKSLEKGDIPVLRMGNIQNGKVSWNGLVYSSDEEEDIKKFDLVEGDLLFNRTNSRELVGKTGLYKGDRKSIYAGYLVRFHMASDIDANYTNFVMNSPLHNEWCNEVKTDAIGQSNINATKLSNFRLPLPPLPEQKAIVAKVEKLLSLCDQLETKISQNQHHAEQLMQAVLKEAFNQGNEQAKQVAVNV